MKQGFQKIADSLESKREKMAAKMFDLVFKYACEFGYCGDEDDEPSLLKSEVLYQSDNPQIAALDLAGDLIDILNEES